MNFIKVILWNASTVFYLIGIFFCVACFCYSNTYIFNTMYVCIYIYAYAYIYNYTCIYILIVKFLSWCCRFGHMWILFFLTNQQVSPMASWHIRTIRPECPGMSAEVSNGQSNQTRDDPKCQQTELGGSWSRQVLS